MTVHVLEFEARSLAAARQQARAARPAHRHVYAETVLADGEPQELRAAAPTVPEALKTARADVPVQARIMSHETLIEPADSTVEVSAIDEGHAEVSMRAGLDPTASVENVRVLSAGRRGFLGIGKELPVFAADVHQPAVVEVTFEPGALIRVEIEDVPDHARCQVCGSVNGALSESGDYGSFACSPRCALTASQVALIALELPLLNARLMLLGAMPLHHLLRGESDAARSRLDERESAEQERRDLLRKLPKVWHCWSCGRGAAFGSRDEPFELFSERCDKCGHSLWLSWTTTTSDADSA